MTLTGAEVAGRPPPEAMPGTFLQRYQQYAGTRTEAPPIYHEFLGHALLGAVLGRRAYLAWADWIFPSFIVCLIGPPSHRKSTAIRIARRLLDLADPACLLPESLSKEGFLDALVEQPTRCLMLSEMETFLGNLSRDYLRGFEGDLNQAYDCEPALRRQLTNTRGRRTHTTHDGETITEATTAANIREAHRPFLSIVGAITPAQFEDIVAEKQFRKGFLTRFLLVRGALAAPLRRPPGPDHAHETLLAAELLAIRARVDACGPEGLRLTIPEPVYDRYDAFCAEHRRWMDTTAEPVSLLGAKMEILPWKLAITTHLADPEFQTQLSLASLETGIDLTLRLRSTLLDTFGLMGWSREERIMKHLTTIIRRLGVHAMHQHVLHESHLEARVFKSFIATMEEGGQLERLTLDRAVYYRLTPSNGTPETAK